MKFMIIKLLLLIFVISFGSWNYYLHSKVVLNDIHIKQLYIDDRNEKNKSTDNFVVYNQGNTGLLNDCIRGTLCTMQVHTQRSALLSKCGIPPRDFVSRFITEYDSNITHELEYGIRPRQIEQLDENWFSAHALFIPDRNLNPGLYFFFVVIDWSFSEIDACKDLETIYPSIGFKLR